MLGYARTPLVRLSQRLASHDWAGALPDSEEITVSVGVAEYEPDEALEVFIARADKALYAAKSNGRNCIAVAPPDKGSRI